MSDDYTPTTGDVRSAYTRAMRQAFIASTGEHIAEFDRWLDQYTCQRQAEALRKAATVMRTCKQPGHWNLTNPRDPEHSMSPDVWIENRAAELENGGDDDLR